jgi:hypothetical protein
MTQNAAVPEYTEWLASSIRRFEALAKSIVAQKPEKGRIVEGVVKSALRAILPGRFSLGTGFAITSSGKISPQLDVIIYDAILNAPVILEGHTGLFPIECIYGFVEVKSILERAGIENAAETIRTIRDFGSEKRYVKYESKDIGDGKRVTDEKEIEGKPLPPRAFIFSVNSKYESADAIEAALKEITLAKRAHVHGLVVLEKDWLFRQLVYKDSPTFSVIRTQAFAHFCGAVLHSIQSMQMFPASMRRYLNLQ